MAKIGVVFSNLGTPRSPQANDVGDYLGEFLMDPYVIQIPFPLRWLLVKGLIVPLRKHRSAANYKTIWSQAGSPLLVETKKTAHALQEQLGDLYQVVVGMRYGEPDFKTCAKQLKDCDSIIFFPQYPQYAASTVQTGLDHFFKFFDKEKVRVIPPYFAEPAFLQAYAGFLQEKLKDLQFDKVLMSFHGLPETHLKKADPSGSHCLRSADCCQRAAGDVLKSCYRAQCYRSAHSIAKATGLDPHRYAISFQSRLGRQKWITPYTEDMYAALVNEGVSRLVVICPGFPVDGLETLEEIALEGKQCFLKGGGKEFHFIPCLNDDPRWIQACVKMIKQDNVSVQ